MTCISTENYNLRHSTANLYHQTMQDAIVVMLKFALYMYI